MKSLLFVPALILLTSTAALSAPAKETNQSGVKIESPKDGARVPMKFKVKMVVTGMTIGPVGDLAKGKGHHHLIVDGGAIPAGQPVPADATHLHFGKGQTEAELELSPGPHRLTLQFADGAHMSYGPAMAQTITVNVDAPKAN